MRLFVLVISSVVSIVSCRNDNNPGSEFVVTGILKNSNSEKVFLEESMMSTGQKIIKDSSDIDPGGNYSLKAALSSESIFNLRLAREPFPFASVVNDSRKITLNADFSKGYDFYTISGSEASQTIKDYLAKTGELLREKYNAEKKIDSLGGVAGSETFISNLDNDRKKYMNDLKNYTQETVQYSKSPSLALFIISTYQGMANNPNYKIIPFGNEELVGLLNEMVTKFPTRTDISGIRDAIQSQVVKSFWVGKMAPEISLPDTEGNNVSLSSFRGKYVLVDFWASWCAPCRQENPNVVDAYNRFRKKNFTVLGVSLDANKEAWKKAIVADNLNWTHISDLKRWESSVVPMYNIQGIPFNVLVNPEGKIIAENLRGSALDHKLEQVLN